MTSAREITLQMKDGFVPSTFNFAPDVEYDDIRGAIREAVEDLSIRDGVVYHTYDGHSLRPINLEHLSLNGLDTILLCEQGHTPEHENFSQAQIRKYANSPQQQKQFHRRDAIVGHLIKRDEKPESLSVVQTQLLGDNRSRSSEKHEEITDPYCDFSLRDGKIRDSEVEIITRASKILLDEDEHKKNHESPHGSQIPSHSTKTEIEGNTEAIIRAPCAEWKTGSIATTSLDGNDKNIYSFKVGHPPFTFSLAGYPYKPNMPPPKYLPYNEIRVLKPLDRKAIFSGQEITKEGELRITDREALRNQEGIVVDVLKRLAKSIAEGRGVVGVSLPIRIFESRSLIERITDWWSFAPVYLTPAAQIRDPIERFKHVIAFAMAGLYVSVSPFKPFNPILGETYQGEFPGYGISVCVEHTSHHPPIANFYLVHKDWKFYGRYEFKGDISTLNNCLTINQEGPNVVEFSDGHKIVFYLPTIRVGGMLRGDKITRYKGIIKFVDEANKLKSVIKFDPSERRAIYDKKRRDVFAGLIYRYTKGALKKDSDEEKFKDLEQTVEEVHGQWLECLYIGEKKWWDINEQTPVRTIPVENPLPSDWRFREDLVWMKRGNKVIAEEWKLFLEVRQREEKKLRMMHKKKQSRY